VPTLPNLPAFPSTTKARRRKAALANQLAAMHGNPNQLTTLRALWQQHRYAADGPMYYAYYASFLNLAAYPIRQINGSMSPDDLAAMRAANYDLSPDLERAMREGEQIDPQNALYNVHLAEYYLSRGVLSATSQGSSAQGGHLVDILINQRFMEMGISEVYRAIKKPYLKYYNMDIVKKRQALFPTPQLTDDYLLRVGDMAGELFPFFAEDRELARSIPACARVLIKEGRVQEALPLLEVWKPLSRLFIAGDDNGSLIQVLVIKAMANIMATGSADIYTQLGQPAKAQRTLADVAVFASHRHPTNDAYNTMNIVQLHGSVLANMLAPIVLATAPGAATGGKQYTTENLAPLRNQEQTLVQEITVSLVVVLLTLGLLLAAVRSGVAMLLQRAERQPLLLLLPSLKQVGIIIGLGIALPIVLYVVYLLSPIGGWEYSLQAWWMVIRRIIDLGLLGLALLCLPQILAKRYLLRRCRALGVAPTDRGPLVRLCSSVFLVMLGWCICLITSIILMYHAADGHSMEMGGLLLIISTVVMVALTRYFARKGGMAMPDSRERTTAYLRFTGTLARSLIPVYALAIILLAGVVQPLLMHQEAYWLAKDRVTLPHTPNDGCSPAETREVQQLCTEMRVASKGW
jgi:hypothetical protein